MCVSLSILSAGLGAGATGGAQVAAGGMLQAGAAGLGALSSLASGVVQSRAARADAAIATAAGAAQAKRIRTAGQTEVSRSRSDAVGAGVSLNSGSVLLAERQIVQNVEQDALSAIATGQSRARALEIQGRNAALNGAIGALGGLASGADKWKRASSAAIGHVPLGGGGGYVPIGGE